MFLDEIVAHLVTAGVGIANPIAPQVRTIFQTTKANIPNPGAGPYLLLIETGGSGPAVTQNNTATERPAAQISARATGAPAARTMLKAAYDALGGADGLYNVTLSGVFYLSIKPKQSITDIGLDTAGRPQVAFNIECEKQPS